MTTTSILERTPFHDIHVRLGAKMVPFAGYEMPVHYPTGITAEHKAVRTGAGLFDVSHMGEFLISGKDALDFVSYVTTNDVKGLAPWQVHYSTILNERGTIEDDCLVYRFGEIEKLGRFGAPSVMMVVNASNREKDLRHILQFKTKFDCRVEDVSDQCALLALQGPKAAGILQKLTPADLSQVKYYHFTVGPVAGVQDIIIARTGYTGEDGFELYFPNEYAEKIWNALMADGNVTPAGLGCRDSLRLEMGMALYGNDIDDTVTPLEANLAWLVKLKKGDFVGRDALVRQKEAGLSKKLVGFTINDRAFPRHGYPVYCCGQPSGEVRSGTLSPTLGIPVGTAYLPIECAVEGKEFEVEIRGKRLPAVVRKMPFYTEASHL
jgi:aminomethyltransferase